MFEAFDAWAKVYRPTAAADHFCFKCGTMEEFERMRRMCEASSRYIYQSIISERRIAIIRFHEPIETALGKLFFLELSDQKPDGSQTSRFEHIEIYPTYGTAEELAASLTLDEIVFRPAGRAHHTTYDAQIAPACEVRIEPEPLIEKIMRDEILRR